VVLAAEILEQKEEQYGAYLLDERLCHAQEVVRREARAILATLEDGGELN
jgi:hypothetical protein